jgi:hypothetical protein
MEHLLPAPYIRLIAMAVDIAQATFGTYQKRALGAVHENIPLAAG